MAARVMHQERETRCDRYSDELPPAFMPGSLSHRWPAGEEPLQINPLAVR